MKWWTADDLGEVYARLLAAPIEFVIIGGQAVNLWSRYYAGLGRQPEEAWAALRPFASRDLDLLGGRLEAAAAAESLNVEVVLFEPSPRWIAPNAGTLYVPLAGEELIVPFLHTPMGARREEIRATSRSLEWKGLRLPVMHPVLLLESKTECFFALEQGSRQDLRHVKLSLLCVRDLIFDLLSAGDERGVLSLLERILDLSLDELGLRLWSEQQLELPEACWHEQLAVFAGTQPKIAAFLENRWPRFLLQLEDRRTRYTASGRRSRPRNAGEEAPVLRATHVSRESDAVSCRRWFSRIRSPMSITLEVPEQHLAEIFRVPTEEVPRQVRIELACSLYGRGAFTHAQAATLAGLDRFAMGEELARRNIARHYTEADLAADVAYGGG